jgi:hypothetical protein
VAPAEWQYTDEEIAQHYEEFYDDVHSEFLQFGELVNFKVVTWNSFWVAAREDAFLNLLFSKTLTPWFTFFSVPDDDLEVLQVCRNGSPHLRGNVYVHYCTEESAMAAYNALNGRFYAGKQVHN